jgi:hypothetical protein
MRSVLTAIREDTMTARPPMVETEEVKIPSSFGQDPGLGRLRFQAEFDQQSRQLCRRGLGLLTGTGTWETPDRVRCCDHP